MAEKILTTRGIYMGGLDCGTGKLLLMRRIKTDSLLKGVSFRGNLELIGGAVMTSNEPRIPYYYYLGELDRLVRKKTGIVLDLGILPTGIPCLYTLPFKREDKDTKTSYYDEASMVPVFLPSPEEMVSSICELIYVSPTELLSLAKEFEPANEKDSKSGKGLVSGYGNRMHCLCLAALTNSPNQGYVRQAEGMLREIMANWP